MKIYQIARLIRLPNLIMMALTLYLVRYCLIGILLFAQNKELLLPEFDFFLLVLSVIFIASAGYIINDYFDTGTDSINKPDKVVVGTVISHQSAMRTYITLNIIAVILGFYLAFKINLILAGLIQFFSIGLLWFYSTTYKKTFLIGNIVIAFLSALLPFIATIYEPSRSLEILSYIKWYAFFAFILTLIREIVKDIEDKKGDLANGCKTLPIVLKTRSTKLIVVFLSLLCMGMLGYVQYDQFISNDLLSFWYFSFTIQIPFFFMTIRLLLAKEQKDYHQVSFLIKIIMFSGILSMVIFYYTLMQLLDAIG